MVPRAWEWVLPEIGVGTKIFLEKNFFSKKFRNFFFQKWLKTTQKSFLDHFKPFLEKKFFEIFSKKFFWVFFLKILFLNPKKVILDDRIRVWECVESIPWVSKHACKKKAVRAYFGGVIKIFNFL